MLSRKEQLLRKYANYVERQEPWRKENHLLDTYLVEAILPTLTLGAKKREEKARKPAKNVGWSGNLQKTWYNRTASNFHNLLLLRYDMV